MHITKTFPVLFLLLSVTSLNKSMQTSKHISGLTKAELATIDNQDDIFKQHMLINALGVGNLHAFKQIYSVITTISPEMSEQLLKMMDKSPWWPSLNAKIITLIKQKTATEEKAANLTEFTQWIKFIGEE
jgi:hypothetical protein